MRIRLLAWACVAGLAALLGPSAASVVDLTGSWTVTAQTLFGPITGTWDFYQTAPQLSVTMIFDGPILFGTSGPFVGLVASATGAFHFDLPATSVPTGFPPCPANTIDGTASADGTTISGTEISYVFHITPPVGCLQAGGAFEGSRCTPGTPGCCAPGGPCCGDLIVEPGEECDGGSCCSAACQLEPSGSACASDGNVCTDDVCDAAGTCQHLANSAPCGRTCQPATCAGGSCTPQGSAAPAGTPCDADANPCTVGDACDGDGTCVAGSPLACPACEHCDPSSSAGCVARPIDLFCQVGTKSRLRLVGAAEPSRRSVRWQWALRHVASDPRQFRDPLTESGYDLCVYDASGLVLRAAVPAGGQCGGKACWQQKAAGFAYRDRAGGFSGIQRISLVAKQSATAESVEGRGSNVDLLASSLTGVVAPLRIQLQAHDAQGLSCWEESYDGSEIEMAGARLTAHH